MAEQAGFSIDDVPDGAGCTLRLHGELDIAGVPALEAAVRRACERDGGALVIDLGGLSFLDSTGLAAIVHAGTLCAKQGLRFELLPGPRSVQRLFEVTGLDGVLPFADGTGALPA